MMSISRSNFNYRAYENKLASSSITEKPGKTVGLSDTAKTNEAPGNSTDSIEISEEARLALEQDEKPTNGETQSPSDGIEDDPEESSEKQSGKVAVNEGKRARQIAAAASKEQVQQVLALLEKDMADCKAGLEQGMCDEAEIAKVEALLSQAKARLSQVPNEADLEEPQAGLSAFEIASLM